MRSGRGSFGVGDRSARAQRALSAAAVGGACFELEGLERRRLMDATAATVAWDATFGSGGSGFTAPMPDGHAATTDAYDHLTPAGGGKFYAIGYGRGAEPRGHTSFELLRVNGDGSLDTSFGNGGAVHFEHASGWTPPVDDQGNPYPMGYDFSDDMLNVGAVLVQPDGKVVVAYQATPQFLIDPWYVERFNTDGTPDASFGDGGSVVVQQQGVPIAWLRPDGKIDLVQADTDQNDDRSIDLHFVQLNADGSPDATVGADGERDTTVTPDWVVPGSTPALDDGSYYGGFAIGAGNADAGDSVVYVQQVGRVGWDTQVPDIVMQVHVDAAGDVTSGKTVYTAQANDNTWAWQAYDLTLTVQPDGKALIADAANGQLTRIGTDGRPDATFGDNGSIRATPTDGFDGTKWIATVGADGKILVTLRDATGTFAGIERFNADGSVDASFGGGEGVYGFGDGVNLAAVMESADGTVLVSSSDWSGYDYTAPNSGIVQHVGRLAPGGGTADTFDLAAAVAAARAAVAIPTYPDDGGSDNGSSDPGLLDDGSDGSGGSGDGSTWDDGSGDGSLDGTYDDSGNADNLGWLDGSAGDGSDAAGDQGFFADPSGATLFNPDGTGVM